MKYRETDLCNELIQMAEEAGWTCYPETCNFDIVLVRDGIQIGVEAKLRLNMEVVAQALKRCGSFRVPRSPHFRAVLVPWGKAGFQNILVPLRILCLVGAPREKQLFRRRSWRNNVLFCNEILEEYKGFLWTAGDRLVLPEFIPKVAAGVPSPIKLTPWKVKMLRVIAETLNTGYITTKQAKKDFGVDLRIAINLGWFTHNGCIGRSYRYELNDEATDRPDQQHPEVFEQILKGPQTDV